jgi:hypothetical protein
MYFSSFILIKIVIRITVSKLKTSIKLGGYMHYATGALSALEHSLCDKTNTAEARTY